MSENFTHEVWFFDDEALETLDEMGISLEVPSHLMSCKEHGTRLLRATSLKEAEDYVNAHFDRKGGEMPILDLKEFDWIN